MYIAIHGVIEGARVVSKNGSIMVKGGIHGKQHQAYVEAKKTVAARFIQEATVVAGENVMVSGHVLDSLVQAGKRVDVCGQGHEDRRQDRGWVDKPRGDEDQAWRDCPDDSATGGEALGEGRIAGERQGVDCSAGPEQDDEGLFAEGDRQVTGKAE